MICPRCKRRNAENANVCLYCGTELKKKPVRTPPMYGPEFPSDAFPPAYGPPTDIQPDVYGPPVNYDNRTTSTRPVVYGPPTIFASQGCGVVLFMLLFFVIVGVMVIIIGKL